MFDHMELRMPSPHSEIAFLRHWGLWHNWHMHNPFVFHAEYRVKTQSTIKIHMGMVVYHAHDHCLGNYQEKLFLC